MEEKIQRRKVPSCLEESCRRTCCSPNDNGPCHQGCEPGNLDRRTPWDPFEDLDPRDDVRDPEVRGLPSRRLKSSNASGAHESSGSGAAVDSSAQSDQEKPRMFGPPPEGLRSAAAEVTLTSGRQISDGFALGPRAQRVITNDAVVGPVRIFTTRCGEKYHTYRSCPHLRNASRRKHGLYAMCALYQSMETQWSRSLYDWNGQAFSLATGASELRCW